MVHKALQIAEPGDVIVVDAGGEPTNAIIDELMLAHAEEINLAGIVINGTVRDLGYIRSQEFLSRSRQQREVRSRSEATRHCQH